MIRRAGGRRLGGERNGPRPGKGEAEASEHQDVSVQPNALDATHAEERQPVLAAESLGELRSELLARLVGQPRVNGRSNARVRVPGERGGPPAA
jgi:hypothetical protein